jgi:hypothetical protein
MAGDRSTPAKDNTSHEFLFILIPQKHDKEKKNFALMSLNERAFSNA